MKNFLVEQMTEPLTDEQKKLVVDMKDIQKIGRAALKKYKIIEFKTEELFEFNKQFIDIWESYIRDHRNTPAYGLLLAVKAFTEGGCSQIEIALICQTIQHIIESKVPDNPLSKEIRSHMAENMDDEGAQMIAKKIKEHFDMR